MKVFEASKKLKKSNKELIAELNDPRIKNHMSKLPKDLEAELFGGEKKISAPVEEPTQTVDTAETTVVEDDFPVLEVNDDGKRCPYTKEEIELGIRCLGGKAPQWEWKHLLEE